MTTAIPETFSPPIFVPKTFTYSIRAPPSCVVFDYPEKPYNLSTKTEGISQGIRREGHKKENKKTKRTRTFYRWVTQNNITETGHDLILPWGLSVEEFALQQLHEAYEKRDFVKRRIQQKTNEGTSAKKIF